MIAQIIPTSPITAIMILSLAVSIVQIFNAHYQQLRKKREKQIKAEINKVGQQNFEQLCITLGYEQGLNDVHEHDTVKFN
ncbi:MAG: hypothetical protein EZS28_041126 [Streblomastix strix]|uniref:Uncharacterized protein n=1 Tax=Streblomastix strix TaxID=222440 RepID=A0A5J4TXY0_9EUKA|nr:MAG: hypothetical protein EZS28_041126 [Streblomastix strix]